MIDPAQWREVAIAREHDRSAFDCGNPDLDTYLRLYARQNHIAGGAKTFVGVTLSAPTRILGYYSISPGEIEFTSVPEAVSRSRGRYSVPVFRLGRLAIDRSFQGLGLGSALLALAATRALLVREHVGGVALAIDAIDARAAAWYQSHGALPLVDDPLKLVLPLATIATADRLSR